MTQQSLASFSKFKNTRTLEGKNNPVPEATAILVKILKAVRKISGLKRKDSG